MSSKPKKSIKEQLVPLGRFLNAYKKFMFVLGILVVIIFLVFRINQFSSAEPTQAQLDEKLQNNTSLKLDQTVLNRIQQLQDQNVEVQSLFDKSRNNPFNE